MCISSKYRGRGRHGYKDQYRATHAVQEHDIDDYYDENEIDDPGMSGEYTREIEDQCNSLSFNTIQISSVSGQKARKEAYVSLQIQLDDIPGQHKLTLKVDTGAQANTLPYRLYKQMFKSDKKLHTY